MRFVLPLLVAVIVLASCFLPWMTIETNDITITGVDTKGLAYGKPAYFHFLCIGLFIIFYSFNRVWTRLIAFVLVTFNTAWALKNFLFLPLCPNGFACPDKRIGLYLLFISSIALFFASLVAPPKEKNDVTKAVTQPNSDLPSSNLENI